MPTVHWHKIDVAVNQQIAFCGSAIEGQWLLVPRFANLDQSVFPLSIVVVITIGIEIVEDLLSDHPLHFPRGHLPVQGIRDDDVDVVNAMTGEHVQHDLQHRLTNVGRGHGRQRQTDIVNSDRYFHARLKLSEQWIATERMIQRVADRGFTIRQSFDWRIGIKDPRPNGNVFENKVLARRHDARRAVAVDVNDRFVCFSS